MAEPARKTRRRIQTLSRPIVSESYTRKTSRIRGLTSIQARVYERSVGELRPSHRENQIVVMLPEQNSDERRHPRGDELLDRSVEVQRQRERRGNRYEPVGEAEFPQVDQNQRSSILTQAETPAFSLVVRRRPVPPIPAETAAADSLLLVFHGAPGEALLQPDFTYTLLLSVCFGPLQ